MNKVTVGQQQTQTVLELINRFGWLTARQLVAPIFHDAKCGQSLAQRLVRRMTDAHLLARRLVLPGVYGYCLTVQGARVLNDRSNVGAVSTARDSLGNPFHRAVSNWYILDRLQSGVAVRTEHEIQCGRAEVRAVHGKIPDGLYFSELIEGWAWTEIEASWKPKHARAKVIAFCGSALGGRERLSLGADHYVSNIDIVFQSTQDMVPWAVEFARAWDAGEISESVVYNTSFIYYPVSPVLAPSEEPRAFNLQYDVLPRLRKV